MTYSAYTTGTVRPAINNVESGPFSPTIMFRKTRRKHIDTVPGQPYPNLCIPDIQIWFLSARTYYFQKDHHIIDPVFERWILQVKAQIPLFIKRHGRRYRYFLKAEFTVKSPGGFEICGADKRANRQCAVLHGWVCFCFFKLACSRDGAT